jgi:integrase
MRLEARRFLAFFGPNVPIETITRDEQHRYVDTRLGLGRASGTVRREMVAYHAAVRFTIEEGLLDAYPFIKLPPGGEPRIVWLDDAQIAHLFSFREQMGERLYRFYRIAFNAPSRSRAIEEVPVGQVFFDRNVIDFRMPGVRYKNKRRGEVPISDELRPELEAWCKDRPPHEPVIGYGKRGKISTTYHSAQRIMKLAGFWKKGFPPRHVCRKTWASQAAQHGVTSQKMEQVLWDRAATIEKNYAFLRPSDAQSTINFKQQHRAQSAP